MTSRRPPPRLDSLTRCRHHPRHFHLGQGRIFDKPLSVNVNTSRLPAKLRGALLN